MENPHISEQEQIRRQALKELENLGVDPYPAAEFPVDTTALEILTGYDQEKNNFQEVTLAGRIMSRRIMGAASFMVIQDHSGRIQVYVKRDDICPGDDKTLYNTVFKKLLDSGNQRICLHHENRRNIRTRQRIGAFEQIPEGAAHS